MLVAVGEALRLAGAVAGEFVPKVVRALGPRATAPPDPPLAVPPGRNEPARLAVQMMLRQHVRALVVQDPRVRRGESDAVHQMRVAARRVRSSLRIFAALVEPEWAQDLAAELAWIGMELGAARDAEVLLDRLDTAAADLAVGDLSVDPRVQLRDVLEAELGGAHLRAEAALQGERYLALIERLVVAAWMPQTTALAERPCVEVLPALARDTWDVFAKRAARLRRRTSPAADYHRVRIAAKRARYAAEACAPILGKQPARFAREMKEVQDVLGEHQDALVASATLRKLGTEPSAHDAYAFSRCCPRPGLPVSPTSRPTGYSRYSAREVPPSPAARAAASPVCWPAYARRCATARQRFLV